MDQMKMVGMNAHNMAYFESVSLGWNKTDFSIVQMLNLMAKSRDG